MPPIGGWPRADVVAVVDVLRATTTIAALLAHGALSVTAVADERAARERARSEGSLLAGEVGGLPPPGFDLGNSPAAVGAASVRGRDVVLFTTNGTRALTQAAAGGATVIAAAAVNLGRCAAKLRDADAVIIACAGEQRGTAFALEDFAAAALLARALEPSPGARVLGDGARLARAIEDPLGLIGRSGHAETLRQLGLESDIAVATAIDRFPVVPVVVASGDGWARLVSS